MAPRGSVNWKRPYTSIYNDNYKYGTGLYSDTLSGIEKRYSDSLSKTQLRSDRPDLTFASFAGSNLTSSPAPGEMSKDDSASTWQPLSRQTSRTSPGRELQRSSSTFESRLNSAWHSSYAVDEEVQDAINSRAEDRKKRAAARASEEESSKPRPKSLYDDASFWRLPKTVTADSADSELDLGKGRERTANGPSAAHWRQKSRLLQEQVEGLETNMSSISNKLSSELSSLKAKCHNEIADLSRSVELTGDQSNDLQKVCKRQANQLLELQSAYDDAQRNIQDALEEMNLYQHKCRSLRKEMDTLRQEVEQAATKSGRV